MLEIALVILAVLIVPRLLAQGVAMIGRIVSFVVLFALILWIVESCK